MRDASALAPRMMPCQLAMLQAPIARMTVPVARSNATDQRDVRRARARNFMSSIVSECRACDVTPAARTGAPPRAPLDAAPTARVFFTFTGTTKLLLRRACFYGRGRTPLRRDGLWSAPAVRRAARLA